MKNFLLLAVLSSMATCLVLADASACLRRRSRPCYRIETMAGGVSITPPCSCTAANGSLGNANKLITAYVVDANHHVFNGKVTYGRGSWSATFPDSPVPQCTCTVVGDDNSADALSCSGRFGNCCKTGGVHIDWCDCASASGTLGNAKGLRRCYVVDKNSKLCIGTITIVGKKWSATCSDSLVEPCTWTVVGDDDSAHAKHHPVKKDASSGKK